LNLRNPSFKL